MFYEAARAFTESVAQHLSGIFRTQPGAPANSVLKLRRPLERISPQQAEIQRGAFGVRQRIAWLIADRSWLIAYKLESHTADHRS